MMDNSQTVPKLTLQRRIESMDLVFMAAGRQECKPSDSSGPRTCSYHMLHFVLKGKVHFYLGGQHYIVNAGQCFYVPEGTQKSGSYGITMARGELFAPRFFVFSAPSSGLTM